MEDSRRALNFRIPQIDLPTKEQIEGLRLQYERTSEIQEDRDTTMLKISSIFALVSLSCLVYKTHFWLLRGDSLVVFVGMLSLLLAVFFSQYSKIHHLLK